MDGRDYDALARDVNLKKITSSKRNKQILRRLRDDDLDVLYIGEADTDYSEFVVRGGNCRGGDDLGWLGFYIGKCSTLEELFIEDMPGDIDQINEFLRGLNRNRSLQVLCINIDLGEYISEKLGDFFRHNKSLYELDLRCFDIGRESARKLAITLCDTSLKSLELTGNGLCKEGFTEIVTEALLGPRALNLRELELRSNGLDDESLQLLAAGLTNNTALEELSLSGNPSITADGLMKSVIPFLQSESCSLKVFFFYNNNIDDAGAAAFAHGLAKNKSLTHLWFDPSDCGMTSTGWQSFATLLCDTSSINNTYLSNHTLELIGESCDKGCPTDEVHDRVRSLLRMRRIANSKEAAISKIFQSHADLDMKPFFTAGPMFLPLVVTWFEKVRSYRMFGRRMLERRELSAVYQFVCGMPLLAVEGRQSPCGRCGRKRKYIDT